MTTFDIELAVRNSTTFLRHDFSYQLEKYKYLSSIETKMSVKTGGISGRTHPSTFLEGTSITLCAAQSPLSVL